MAGGHLDAATLRRLAEGELAEAARPGVARHLRACHRCRGRLLRLCPGADAALRRLLRQGADADPAGTG